jgi:hypothetical protein
MGMAQVVEHLPSKYEAKAQSSNPSAERKTNKRLQISIY